MIKTCFLFRGLFPQLSGRTTHKSLKRNATTQPGGSKKKKNFDPSFIKDTWTREFSCLPSHFSTVTPSSDMQNTLSVAGLGKKKIVFDKNDDHATVCRKIESA